MTGNDGFCPKCKSRLYSGDGSYIKFAGVCSYCVCYDNTPDKRFQKKYEEGLKKTTEKYNGKENEMNICTLEGLRELANNKKKAVCAWTPKNPPLNPPEDNPDRIWIHDTAGNPENYCEEKDQFSLKIVVEPSEEINQKKEEKMETFELFNGYDRKKKPEKDLFRSITFEEAKNLYYGQTVKMIDHLGNAWRNVKINGKVQTWKRDPNRIRIPCKYGMYECFRLNQSDFNRIVVEVEKDEWPKNREPVNNF